MGVQAEKLGAELRFWRAVARLIPPWPHSTALVNRLMKPIYLRKPRPEVVVEVAGARMRLSPHEVVDAALLFYPHLYDRSEFEFLRSRLRPGDVFLDLGANIGAYSLRAAPCVGRTGRVLAVEANPTTFQILQAQLELNDFPQIEAVNVGLSDREEVLAMALDTGAGRAGNSFAVSSARSVDLACRPLLSVLQEVGITSVAGMKIDIEGFEFRVLREFFGQASSELWPRWAILEFNHPVEGDPLQLMLEHGYQLRGRHGANALLTRGSD